MTDSDADETAPEPTRLEELEAIDWGQMAGACLDAIQTCDQNLGPMGVSSAQHQIPFVLARAQSIGALAQVTVLMRELEREKRMGFGRH